MSDDESTETSEDSFVSEEEHFSEESDDGLTSDESDDETPDEAVHDAAKIDEALEITEHRAIASDVTAAPVKQKDKKHETPGKVQIMTQDEAKRIFDDFSEHTRRVNGDSKMKTIYKKMPEPITPFIIHKYEQARLISTRTAIIEKSGDCLVATDDCLTSHDMALKEFKMRRCPLVIQRTINSLIEVIEGEYVKVNYIEHINPNESFHSET